MSDRILVLPGDGIGPEVTREALRALEAVAKRFRLSLAFDEALIGHGSIAVRHLRTYLLGK